MLDYLVFHALVPVVDVVVVVEAADDDVARGELDLAHQSTVRVRAGDPVHALVYDRPGRDVQQPQRSVSFLPGLRVP